MSRNDIRLRRKMMTSRRIGRYKDYGNLMNKYKRSSAFKRWYKWLALVLLLAILLMIFVFVL